MIKKMVKILGEKLKKLQFKKGLILRNGFLMPRTIFLRWSETASQWSGEKTVFLLTDGTESFKSAFATGTHQVAIECHHQLRTTYFYYGVILLTDFTLPLS